MTTIETLARASNGYAFTNPNNGRVFYGESSQYRSSSALSENPGRILSATHVDNELADVTWTEGNASNTLYFSREAMGLVLNAFGVTDKRELAGKEVLALYAGLGALGIAPKA